MATFGSENTGTGTVGSGIENNIMGGYWTCPEAGTADSITIRTRATTADHKFKCMLYKETDNSLVGTTEELTVLTADGWHTKTFNFSAPKPSLENISYCIVAWAEATGGSAYLSYLTAAGIERYQDSHTYNNPPNPWVPALRNAGYEARIKCDYTAGGVEHTHSASDTLAISDSLAAAMTFNVAASDTLAIGDSLATPVMQFNVALADTLNISDALSVAATYNVALADTLNISDSLAVVAAYAVALADTMSISDSVAAAAVYRVALADTMEISDSLTVAEIVAVIKAIRRKQIYGLKPARVVSVGRIGV